MLGGRHGRVWKVPVSVVGNVLGSLGGNVGSVPGLGTLVTDELDERTGRYL